MGEIIDFACSSVSPLDIALPLFALSPPIVSLSNNAPRHPSSLPGHRRALPNVKRRREDADEGEGEKGKEVIQH